MYTRGNKAMGSARKKDGNYNLIAMRYDPAGVYEYTLTTNKVWGNEKGPPYAGLVQHGISTGNNGNKLIIGSWQYFAVGLFENPEVGQVAKVGEQYVGGMISLSMPKDSSIIFVLSESSGGRIRLYDLAVDNPVSQGSFNIPTSHGEYLGTISESEFYSWKREGSGVNIWRYQLCSLTPNFELINVDSVEYCKKSCLIGQTWESLASDTCIACPTGCETCEIGGAGDCETCAVGFILDDITNVCKPNCTGNDYISSSNTCIPCSYSSCKNKANGGCQDGTDHCF
jgi:hypothetical protein